MKDSGQSSSPISFPVHVARLPRKGMPVEVVATPQQREVLAEEHALLSVESLRADLLVAPWNRNGVKVTGRVRAEITQQCIVTLEPLVATIDEPVEAVFLPEDSRLGREGFGAGGEILLDVEGPDSPEIFTGDHIDVGALAEEFFAVAIDPYPRKAGAGSAGASPAAEDGPDGPLQEKLRALFPKK